MKSTSVLSSGIYTARPQKINQHIEIVSSSVSGLSSMSKRSRNGIYDVLAKHYTKVGITIVDNLADLEGLAAMRPDLVFLGMMYIPVDPSNPRGKRRIWLSTYLEEQNIAHTGSGQEAHQLELNKSLAKQRVLEAGLKTSPFYVVKQNQTIAKHANLSFPLFIKPVDRGGGQGVDHGSLVGSQAELQLKVDNITDILRADSLVEEYLPGREFSVAILKNEFSDQISVMPVELVTETDEHGVSLLSSAVKSSNSEVVSMVTNAAIRTSVCELAIAAFKALGGRDYGRIDIRLDKAGQPNFLEANLLPSLIGGYGSFPKACLLNIKLDYEPMILTIVRLALSRQQTDIRYVPKLEIQHVMTPIPFEPVI